MIEKYVEIIVFEVIVLCEIVGEIEFKYVVIKFEERIEQEI